jgi:hypothetical protein
MNNFVRLLAVVLAAILWVMPLMQYLTLRRRGATRTLRARVILTAYYAITVAALLLYILFLLRLDRWVEALPGLLLGGVMLLGPGLVVLTPLVLPLLRRWMPPARDICSCAYSLVGNQSGVCPECGATTSGEARARRPAGRVLGPASAIVTLLLILTFCYYQEGEIFTCTECGRYGSRTSHSLGVPVGEPMWTVYTTSIRARKFGSLAKVLDPTSTCEHRWKSRGRYARSLMAETSSGTVMYPLGPTAAMERDFPAFLAVHPDVRERIRESLSRQENMDEWLLPMLEAWRESNADSPPPADEP